MDTKPRARPNKTELAGLNEEDQKALCKSYRSEYQRWWKVQRAKDPKLQALDKAMDLVRYHRKNATPEGRAAILKARDKAETKRGPGTMAYAERSAVDHIRYHERKTADPEGEKIRNKIASQKHRLKKYGLTKEVYERLKAEQNNRCALCDKEESIVKRSQVCELSIDHNHKTGKVRGLLCNNCNRAMGLFKDDVEVVRNALAYLKKDLPNED